MALIAINAIEVRAGLAERLPPYGICALRVCLAPCCTQSGHWKPTAAGTMQSGQIERSQRWHLM